MRRHANLILEERTVRQRYIPGLDVFEILPPRLEGDLNASVKGASRYLVTKVAVGPEGLHAPCILNVPNVFCDRFAPRNTGPAPQYQAKHPFTILTAIIHKTG